MHSLHVRCWRRDCGHASWTEASFCKKTIATVKPSRFPMSAIVATASPWLERPMVEGRDTVEGTRGKEGR